MYSKSRTCFFKVRSVNSRLDDGIRLIKSLLRYRVYPTFMNGSGEIILLVFEYVQSILSGTQIALVSTSSAVYNMIDK